MKKAVLFLFLVMSAISFSAQAGHVDCPLKNLKKNQLRSADGTAYFPKSMKSSQSSSGSLQSIGN